MGREKRAQALKAPRRTFAHAPIDEHHRNVLVVGGTEKVGPKLALHKNHEIGSQRAQAVAHDP